MTNTVEDSNINPKYLNAIEKFTKEEIENANKAADYWYNKIGANVISADTKIKKAWILKSWTKYQSSPIPLEVFERWKELGLFAYGIAAVLGLLWRGKYAGYRFILVDIDRKEGVIAFLDAGDRAMTLEELADRQYVEFNGVDRDQRIHIPYILEHDAEIAAKGADDKVGIEVNINGVMFGAGSPHHKGGFYEQLGKASEIRILDKTQAFTLQEHIASICQKYGVNYSGNNAQEKEKFDQAYTAHLHDGATRIKRGGRHEVIKFISCSYFTKYTGEWDNLTDDERFERVLGYDMMHCDPPLDETDPQEVRDLWNWARKTFRDSRDEQREVRRKSNVHNALRSNIELLIIRNYPTASLEEIKEWCMAWNKKHCNPPLDENEFEKQWKSGLDLESVREKIAAVATATAALGGETDVPEQGQPSLEALETELAPEIPDRDYAEFLFEAIKCNVKQEESLVRQIAYTAMSKDTKDPINLAIIAPTSEGKTYAVLETLKYFPPEDVRKIGSMSSRVLIRDNGILVDSDGQPIGGKIKELEKKIEKENFRIKIERRRAMASKTKKRKQDVKDDDLEAAVTVEINRQNDLDNLQEQLEQISDNARNLIDLNGMCS